MYFPLPHFECSSQQDILKLYGKCQDVLRRLVNSDSLETSCDDAGLKTSQDLQGVLQDVLRCLETFSLTAYVSAKIINLDLFYSNFIPFTI